MTKYYYILYLISSIVCAHIIVPPKIHFFKQAIQGPRISSEPFISGDTFRVIADFVVDERQEPIDTKKIKSGSIFFVKPEYFEFFFASVHPHINAPFILISHNSDLPAPGKYKKYLNDANLIAWFGQNGNCIDHPKFCAIPIGLENRYWKLHNINTVARLRAQKYEKKHLLYMNFNEKTNKDARSHVADLFKNKPFCHMQTRKPFEEYLIDLAQSYFVLSPAGNGLDCHRTWEALLMGAIPVVKHSTLDPMFEQLPVVLIDDWSHVTEEFLETKLIDMQQQKYDYERMFSAYWINKILSLKNFL
jgi:hypothetical protein